MQSEETVFFSRDFLSKNRKTSEYIYKKRKFQKSVKI